MEENIDILDTLMVSNDIDPNLESALQYINIVSEETNEFSKIELSLYKSLAVIVSTITENQAFAFYRLIKSTILKYRKTDILNRDSIYEMIKMKKLAEENRDYDTISSIKLLEDLDTYFSIYYYEDYQKLIGRIMLSYETHKDIENNFLSISYLRALIYCILILKLNFASCINVYLIPLLNGDNT